MTAIRDIGRTLLQQQRRGLAMTPLKESLVSPSGWPDFFVSGASGRAACLSVCMDDGNPDAAPLLFSGAELPGSLPAMVQRLLDVRESWAVTHPESAAVPSLMVLCPRYPEAALRREFPELACRGALLAGRESCDGPALPKALTRLPAGVATDEDIILLRAHLAPETVLRQPPSARRRQTRQHQLSLLPQLLDYDQDRCAKIDLWLPDESVTTAENLSLRLITGAAGTGKSVVLVHRAAMLRQFHRSARILVLTHNRALRGDLESRFQRMNGGDVEFLTFHSWLSTHWRCETKVLDDKDRMAHIPASDMPQQFLKDEFDWLHDQGILTLEDYLTAQRAGRTRALREPQRRALFAHFLAYREKLDAAQATDWSRRPCDALAAAHRPPAWDFILVDEAQFFARTWLQLVRSALRPGGHLFLCADPAQGFLGRGQSWRDAGLQVVGRSHVLKRPYRNTRQILSFAAAAYERQTAGDDEAQRLAATEPSLLREGPEPAEIRVASPQEEIAAVVRQVQDLLAGGMAARDLLILCARKRQVDLITERLTAAGIAQSKLDDPHGPEDTHLRIGTLDAATGLERPVVILCGQREFASHEENPTLPADERRRHRRQNASRFYMACTRAMERLVIVSCG